MDSEKMTSIQFLSMYQNNPKKETANERKATEIAQSVSFFWTNEDDAEKSIIDTVALREAIYNAALQAMAWKDERHEKEKQQWIYKSAFIAEIEELMGKYRECSTRNDYENGLKDGRLIGYRDALYKISTLEVKEVDL